VAQIPAFLREADAAVTKLLPGVRILGFGHVGDGNVHYNIFPPPGADEAAFLARWHEIGDVVYEVVNRHGGSISAEHGVGALKARWLPLVRSEAERALFARIRSAFDPDGILNPHVLPRWQGEP